MADDIAVHTVQLDLCELCIRGEGGECHVPGCSMWINRAPDLPLDNHPSFVIVETPQETDERVKHLQASYYTLAERNRVVDEAYERVRSNMQRYADKGIRDVNVKQVLHLLSRTWPDGNYGTEAAS